jgi:plasmid maintenance system antidote protein VapI
MPRKKRSEPDLPPGPARDLVDLFAWLRASRPMRVGQIANRAGYAPGHVSEVLRGWKAPSPDAAARIARVLGADDMTVRRARRRAEDLRDWKRAKPRRRRPAGRPDDGQGFTRQGSLEIVRAELRIVISAGVTGESTWPTSETSSRLSEITGRHDWLRAGALVTHGSG